MAVKYIKPSELYKLIPGTDSSSRYRVVATADGLVIAARLRESTGILSVRAAGPKVDEYAAKLLSAGFGKKGGGHYSTHLKVGSGNLLLARRSLGAMLIGTNILFDEIGLDFNSVKEGVT